MDFDKRDDSVLKTGHRRAEDAPVGADWEREEAARYIEQMLCGLEEIAATHRIEPLRDMLARVKEAARQASQPARR